MRTRCQRRVSPLNSAATAFLLAAGIGAYSVTTPASASAACPVIEAAEAAEVVPSNTENATASLRQFHPSPLDPALQQCGRSIAGICSFNCEIAKGRSTHAPA